MICVQIIYSTTINKFILKVYVLSNIYSVFKFLNNVNIDNIFDLPIKLWPKDLNNISMERCTSD